MLGGLALLLSTVGLGTLPSNDKIEFVFSKFIKPDKGSCVAVTTTESQVDKGKQVMTEIYEVQSWQCIP